MKEMIPMKQASGNLFSRNPSAINGGEQRQEDFQQKRNCRRLVFSMGCLKAYHPKCAGVEDSVLTSDEPWICGKPLNSSFVKQI
ncbi:hypothetical protein MTR67_005729 [Solanum verrucosum]|uniref:Uncharacterized protein n=1 Tax=Solanum verrucosum TaxID=315347 RepID=A0AAF0PWG4_SOLVR|nr:hypothetical protein MTR67_005729 [Solanum verrucosum]